MNPCIFCKTLLPLSEFFILGGLCLDCYYTIDEGDKVD